MPVQAQLKNTASVHLCCKQENQQHIAPLSRSGIGSVPFAFSTSLGGASIPEKSAHKIFATAAAIPKAAQKKPQQKGEENAAG